MMWQYHKGNYKCPKCKNIVDINYIKNYTVGINKNLMCDKCGYSGYIGYIKDYREDSV